MKPLFLSATKATPLITYDVDTNILEISGECYPENSLEFFAPIQSWLREHLAETTSAFRLNLRLHYFNTSSSKCLLDLIRLLEERHASLPHVEIYWYYKAKDDDMLESGEEFADGLALPFHLVSY